MTTINIYLPNKMYQPELGPEKENIFHIFTVETLLVEILTYRQSKVPSYKNRRSSLFQYCQKLVFFPISLVLLQCQLPL